MKPLSSAKWNEPLAAHLLNRAGFGGSPSAIRELADLGLDGAVDRLVDFPVGNDDHDVPTWVKPGVEKRQGYKQLQGLPEEEKQALRKTMQRLNRFRLFELQAWWLYRMRYDAFPLREKMTLFLHGHFATAVNKVKSAYPLYKQNQMFRKHAGGNWRTLVTEVARDPAMLIYLDNARSNKRKPNENFARELMELFTLGEGHYSEEDIKDVARAFTGWSMKEGVYDFFFRERMHDDGEKTIFGQTGNFGGEDVIKMIVENPQSADFLAWKLTRFFVSDTPDKAFQKALASDIRAADYEIKPVLRSLFSSEAFYQPTVIRGQIKSPVQWLVGMLHHLECPMPPPHRNITMLDQLGQHLFHPPNVKGWDGGFAWITASSLLSRYNFAGEIVHYNGKPNDLVQYRKRAGAFMDVMNMDPQSMAGGSMMSAVKAMDEKMDAAMRPEELKQVPAEDWPYGSRPGMLVKIDKVLPPEDRRDPARIRQVLTQRLFQSRLRPEDEQKFAGLLETLPSVETWSEQDVRTILHLMMSTPQYQMV